MLTYMAMIYHANLYMTKIWYANLFVKAWYSLFHTEKRHSTVLTDSRRLPIIIYFQSTKTDFYIFFY